jgi:flagellar motility protein MotE (MotC chaperone)
MFRLLRLDDDLDRQARDLAMSYRRAPEEGRAKIKATINDLVNKQFDARQQRRLLEVKRLEEDLKRLREAIDRRKESRDTLVKKRVAQLIGDDEELNF